MLLRAPVIERLLVTSGYGVFRTHIYIAAKMPDWGTKEPEAMCFCFQWEQLQCWGNALWGAHFKGSGDS
jgi:hypothetical protein